MGDVTRVNGNSLSPSSNGLTSDILRARAVEYYNNYLPHTPRLNTHKTGSANQLNGFAARMAPKLGKMDYRNGSYPHRTRNDRPQRTHSERASCLFQHHNQKAGPNKQQGMYRSNSSLDLDNDENVDERSGALKREYGSASSLDMIAGDGFFAMLRDYRSDHADQRSPGPAKIHEYLRGKVDPTPTTQNAANVLTNGSDCLDESQSPKLKTKFHKLWEIRDKGKTKTKVPNSEQSIFRKFRGGGGKSESAPEINGRIDSTAMDAENRLEEKLRKKAFAHYDCQSLTANLSYASRLCSLLSKRRNTTTGASAASMLNRTPSGSTEELDDADSGDGRSNSLLLSCPFFRNEVGGEEERVVSLNRMTCKRQRSREDRHRGAQTLHRPFMACGLAVLENANLARWRHRSCPYQRPSLCIENVDAGALYYRNFFYNQEHQNWFGIDESLGPVAISIKREKVEEPAVVSSSGNSLVSQFQYRLIIRTSELAVMRGTVLEEAIPTLARSSSPRGTHAKEVLEYVAPELQLSTLRIGVQGAQTEEQLLKLDEQGLMKMYKVGVMYCKAGQSAEEEMYNNEHSGPAFEEFLEMLGQRVRLKGFDKYRAGLDNKTDTTGLYSIYSTYQDTEIMFHVSTMLPYTPNNRQQLLRKRHIGNDIVTIVFQEPDALPFTPKSIRSHFQHVFIIIRAINPCTDTTRYHVAVSRSKEVPVFGPAIPEGATFPKSKAFADFLLAKVINAENAAHHSEKFATMAQRTRQEYLKDLAANYVTGNTTIDSGPKFSILSFGGRKKERLRQRFIPDSYVQGGISWQVQVEDFGQSTVIDCLLGISIDTLVLIEETSKEMIFVCPTSSVLGWSSNTNSLKLFYHQGECIIIRAKDPDVDEIQEMVVRLGNVTKGCETQELILRRNSLGQLGFHVQFEGVVTEVEGYGFAWQAGLRQNSRLVEICKVTAATLSYDQMVDLLKTSMTVSVTVIPPLPDGSPRRGCVLQNCSYLTTCSVGDYENIGGNENEVRKAIAGPRQQTPIHSQNGRISARHGMGSDSLNKPQVPIEAKNKEVLLNNHYRQDSHKDNRKNQSTVDTPTGRSVMTSSSSPYVKMSGNGMRFNESPSHATQSPASFSHHHMHRSLHDYHHRNGQLMHVGGMVASRSELSLTDIIPSHTRTHSHHKIASSARAPCRDYGRVGIGSSKPPSWSPSTIQDKQPKSLPSVVTYLDYQSDSSSEWHQGTGSADELSGGSHRSTPPRIQVQKNALPHSEASNTNSPNLTARPRSETVGNHGRLRPGVTPSSTRPAKGGSNLSSSSGSSNSTLQDDLLKLINPDFLDSDSNSEDLLSNRPESSPSEQPSTPYSSLDRSKSDNRCNEFLDSGENGDVILIKAQPAQVISSEPSSPAPTESHLSREERLSPRVTSNHVLSKLKPPPPPPTTMMPLPDNREFDWPSLVDTATKAIAVGLPISKPNWLDELSEKLRQDSNSSTPNKHLQDLQARVWHLQQDLEKEQHQKANLQQQVHHLQQENQRLQEESQSAAAQLRKFTTWFLHNMDS